MPHFYVRPENINKNIFTIDAQQAHYISTVRRINIDDEIMIFDGLGNSYKAKITAASKTHIEGKILSSSYKMPAFSVNLYTAVPKGDRFEWLIEKSGELGIREIIPINTKRSVNMHFSENKLERYEKISIAASSQCGRNDIMKINRPIDFKMACEKAAVVSNFINIIPWESAGGETSLIENILQKSGAKQGANIFIGPEGGFENEEIGFAQNLGIKTVSLGENILRVETAAIAAIVLVLNYFGVYKSK